MSIEDDRARDDEFVKWKSVGVTGEAQPCDECRLCRGWVVTRVLWAVFASCFRFAYMFRGDRYDIRRVYRLVHADVICPMCSHTAFWHSGSL